MNTFEYLKNGNRYALVFNQSQFLKDGFIVFKGLFSRFDIEEIKIDALKIFSLQLARLNLLPDTSISVFSTEFEEALFKFFKLDFEAFTNCGKHIQHLISLHKLSLDNNIIDFLRLLGLSFPNICTRPVLFFNHPKLAIKDIYHTFPAHQDFKSMQSSLDSMVVWLPLTKITKDMGALQVVPGSHQQGLITSRVEEGFGLVDKYQDSDFISVELEPGDALFFSSFLVHRSGNNITNNIRWSAHFRYSNMDDKDFISRKFPHPYVYKPLSKDEG